MYYIRFTATRALEQTVPCCPSSASIGPFESPAAANQWAENFPAVPYRIERPYTPDEAAVTFFPR